MSIVNIIYAQDINGNIGLKGPHPLPWHAPADLQRFKALTQDCPMIMGRSTFASLPGLLPGRFHIVLTSDPALLAIGHRPMQQYVKTMTEAITLANHMADNIFIIGGAGVINDALDFADVVYRTTVMDVSPLVGDLASVRQYSKIDPVWKHYVCTEKSSFMADGHPTLLFETFHRTSEE